MRNNHFQNQERSEIDPIDLTKLILAIWKKKWLVAGAAIAGMLLSLLITLVFISPKYQSSVMFYVNNSSVSLGDAALSITSSDISASRGLVESYIVILNARETLLDVIDYAEVDLDCTELSKMLSAEAVSNTEIFQVVVTGEDPQQAEKIANAVAYILPKRISSIIEGTSAKIVDSAVVATSPSSPSYSINAVLGFLASMLLSAGGIVLWVILDITIRAEEDVTQNCRYPVLAAVPDMESHGKGGYSYSYDRDRNKQHSIGQRAALMGDGISFAAAEAYKLLRTKLQFSFADESSCRIIGISSALSGEGKSVTSVNLAYSLAQLGKRVILIDCDMRRPTLAEKLHIQKKPGLSNFLAGQVGADHLIQPCGMENDKSAFFVITAGENPPNPIELLSSQKMEQLLANLKNLCDYVILDLPPVNEVSDALAVAKQTDGLLLVVRQDLCNRLVLNDMVRQFEFVDARILGIVYNCITEGTGKYGYKQKYYKEYTRKSKPKDAARASRANKVKRTKVS